MSDTDLPGKGRKGRRLDPHVYRRRRRPGEILTLRATIRANCLHCCGWNTTEVAACTSHACWCWPWRLPGPPSLDGEDATLIERECRDPAPESRGNPSRFPNRAVSAAEIDEGATKRGRMVSEVHRNDLRGSQRLESRPDERGG